MTSEEQDQGTSWQAIERARLDLDRVRDQLDAARGRCDGATADLVFDAPLIDWATVVTVLEQQLDHLAAGITTALGLLQAHQYHEATKKARQVSEAAGAALPRAKAAAGGKGKPKKKGSTGKTTKPRKESR